MSERDSCQKQHRYSNFVTQLISSLVRTYIGLVQTNIWSTRTIPLLRLSIATWHILVLLITFSFRWNLFLVQTWLIWKVVPKFVFRPNRSCCDLDIIQLKRFRHVYPRFVRTRSSTHPNRAFNLIFSKFLSQFFNHIWP